MLSSNMPCFSFLKMDAQLQRLQLILGALIIVILSASYYQFDGAAPANLSDLKSNEIQVQTGEGEVHTLALRSALLMDGPRRDRAGAEPTPQP